MAKEYFRRDAILRDLAADGPMALPAMREAYGSYSYACIGRARLEGLVEFSERTRCYTITEAGRRLVA